MLVRNSICETHNAEVLWWKLGEVTQKAGTLLLCFCLLSCLHPALMNAQVSAENTLKILDWLAPKTSYSCKFQWLSNDTRLWMATWEEGDISRVGPWWTHRGQARGCCLDSLIFLSWGNLWGLSFGFSMVHLLRTWKLHSWAYPGRYGA